MKKLLLNVSVMLSIIVIFDFICNSEVYAASYIVRGVTVEESADNSLKAVADGEFNSFPDSVKNSFTANGWRYVITKKGDLGRIAGKAGWKVDGYTDKAAKTIYINGEIKDMDTLYHEMGHFIDLSYSINNGTGVWYSDAPEFQTLFKSESRAAGEYAMNSPAEFFAEVVHDIMIDPQTISVKCPGATKYVNSCLVGAY